MAGALARLDENVFVFLLVSLSYISKLKVKQLLIKNNIGCQYANMIVDDSKCFCIVSASSS